MAKKREENDLDPTQADLDRAEGDEPGAAKEKKIDETVPGGRYIVDGRLVDCDGKPLAK